MVTGLTCSAPILVFWGGKVVWQNIHDCRIDAYADSMFKLEPYGL